MLLTDYSPREMTTRKALQASPEKRAYQLPDFHNWHRQCLKALLRWEDATACHLPKPPRWPRPAIAPRYTRQPHHYNHYCPPSYLPDNVARSARFCYPRPHCRLPIWNIWPEFAHLNYLAQLAFLSAAWGYRFL